MEDHASELSRSAVGVLNMDSAVFNPDRPLSVGASGSLRTLWRDVARDLRDPRSGRPLYDVWLEMQNQFRRVPSVDRPMGAEKAELTAPEIPNVPIGDG